MADIIYEIVERIAVLSENKGWTKELNKVSWSNRPAKLELRDWNYKEGKVGKGFTLNNEEVENLRKVLNSIKI